MSKLRTLKVKLIVLFVLFSLVPASILGIVSAYMNMSAAEESTAQANMNTAHQMASEIDRLLGDAQGLVETLAGAPSAQAMDKAAIRNMILVAQQKNPQFELIYVMDASGMQIARTSGDLANRKDRPYFQAAMQGKNYISDSYISAFTNAPCVTISAPIHRPDGSIAGVMAADISLKSLWNIADQVKVGKSGYIDIVDNKGTIVAHPDKKRVLKKESFASLPYISQVIGGQSNFVKAKSSRGENSLIVFTPVEKYHWGVVAYEPVTEIFASVIRSAVIAAAIILLILLFAIAIAYYTAQSIAKPVQELANVSEQVAAGNLANSVNVYGALEVKRLSAGFNRMIDSLRAIITRASATAVSVADSSQELAAAAGQLGKASDEVIASVQYVVEGTGQQVTLSEQSFQVIEAMSGAIADTTQAAHSVATTSEKSEQAAALGADQAEQAVVKMNQIRADVGQATQIIHNLGEKSRQIGEIMGVIAEIAGQTNLLALNAAIEAARAGEQGRGFAVVAEEVRRLAEQSETAAKEIFEIVNSIQMETGEAVQAMDKGSQEVQDGAEVVEASGRAFREIYQAIKAIRQDINHIVELTERQQTAGVEVERTVRLIADAARLNADRSGNMAAASEEQNASVAEMAASAAALAKMAADLQEVVKRFKV
ncbi:Hypothetical protein LUCI_3444 [Lucifera butyrica]|uniref:Chemotaxis methyl-accepting receptor n=1 Tax=Lucifera butyrica TaxID=1351585 RepID=A0A498R618_9FIRM|nr:methyl-accepting chemotaxis protein [Lucifera butyrica]VBB08176.1 Hypothetical protein LUCI_3444 [Lucifera butyrica]